MSQAWAKQRQVKRDRQRTLQEDEAAYAARLASCAAITAKLQEAQAAVAHQQRRLLRRVPYLPLCMCSVLAIMAWQYSSYRIVDSAGSGDAMVRITTWPGTLIRTMTQQLRPAAIMVTALADDL